MLYTQDIRKDADKEKLLTLEKLDLVRLSVEEITAQIASLKEQNAKIKHSIKRYIGLVKEQ